jgi:hypothetical protein
MTQNGARSGPPLAFGALGLLLSLGLLAGMVDGTFLARAASLETLLAVAGALAAAAMSAVTLWDSIGLGRGPRHRPKEKQAGQAR